MDLRKKLIAASLLFVSTSVYADPITAFFTLVGNAVAAVTVGQVLFTAGSLLFGSAQQRKLKKRALAEQRRQKDEYNAGLSDRTVNGIGSEFPSRHVFGTARIGGNIVDIITSGDRDQFQHLIALGTQHQIDDFPEVYINGKPVGTLDGNGYATTGSFVKNVPTPFTETFSTMTFVLTHPPLPDSLTVTTVLYSDEYGSVQTVNTDYTISGLTVTVFTLGFYGHVTANYTRNTTESSIRITKHLGIPGGSYDVNTHNETGGKLKTTSVFSGHSYLAIRLNLDEPEFQNLPAVEMLVRRNSMFDVRTGAVTANAGTNPALVAHEYLKGPLCNIENIVLPVAQYITAANDCDVVVNNGDGNRKRYTFNGVVSSDQSREEVLQRIADSMAGGIVATTWNIYAGVYRAPVMPLNETDIVGSLSVTPGSSELEIFNTIYGRFATADNAYLEKDYRRYVQNTYLAVDGGELEVGIAYPYTITQTEVDQLNRIAIEQARNDFTISADFSLKAWTLKVGDRVYWTSPFMGQTNTTYRVVDRSSGTKPGVSLILKQDTPEMYDLVDAVTAPSVPPSTLPNPWLIEPPTNLSVFSGTSTLIRQGEGSLTVALKVSWFKTAPLGLSRNAIVEIEAERLTGTNLPEIIKVQSSEDETNAFVSPVQEGETYRVKARLRNVYSGAVSPWVYAVPHVAKGKSDPPSAVTDVSLTQDFVFWKPVIDLDVIYGGGYQVRVAAGTTGVNVTWERASIINTGTITDSPYRLPVRLFGVQTIFVAALDSSGNIGAAGSAVLNFGVVPTNNIAQSRDYQAENWPGIIQGGTVGFGVISADTEPISNVYSLSDIYSEPDVYATLWQAISYESELFTTSFGGTTLTLASGITGSGATIEYRVLSASDVYALVDVYAASSVYGELTPWQIWPGSLLVDRGSAVQWRLSASAGSQRAQITQLTVYSIAQRGSQTFSNVAISSSGARLDPLSGDPPRKWIDNGIRNITLLPIGIGAVGGRIRDFNSITGPLVEMVNNTGTAISGNATCSVEGLFDV